MSKLINIAEILKNAPKDTKLYSPLFGECKLINISLTNKYCINITYRDNDNVINDACFDKYGRYFSSCGECCLFPSKEQKDWTKFKIDLPIDTPVMVKDRRNYFMLRHYAGNNTCFIRGNTSKNESITISYECIIPFDKFNPNDIEESLKHNIVKD